MSEGIAGLSPAELEEMIDSGGFDLENGRLRKVGGSDVTEMVTDVDTVILWDRRTGVPSTVRTYEGNNTVVKMLGKVDPATGERIFTTRKPDIEPAVGRFVCYFHHDHPDYERYMAQGFRPCPRAGIPNETEVLKHVRNRHASAWETIERERERDKESAQREQQSDVANAILAAVQAMAGQQVTPPSAPVHAPAASEPEPDGYSCDLCTFASASAAGLKTHVTRVHSED